MKEFILLFAIIAYKPICFAQTTIDGIEDGSHLKIGVGINSRIAFAGQSLGIANQEMIPSIYYKHKNGLYASINTQTYNDPLILKKASIANADFSVGYLYSSDKFSSDNNFAHSQVFYGNKFFRNFLTNAISSENTYSVSENIDITANAMLLFSKGKKWQTAPIFEWNAQYNFYIDDALGAEQVRISPNCSYFFGSDKIASTTVARDTLSDNNKKVATTNTMRGLSIIPAVTVNWQKAHHQLDLDICLPIANTENASTIGTYRYQTTMPIFSIQYHYYLGFAQQE